MATSIIKKFPITKGTFMCDAVANNTNILNNSDGTPTSCILSGTLPDLRPTSSNIPIPTIFNVYSLSSNNNCTIDIHYDGDAGGGYKILHLITSESQIIRVEWCQINVGGVTHKPLFYAFPCERRCA